MTVSDNIHIINSHAHPTPTGPPSLGEESQEEHDAEGVERDHGQYKEVTASKMRFRRKGTITS